MGRRSTWPHRLRAGRQPLTASPLWGETSVARRRAARQLPERNSYADSRPIPVGERGFLWGGGLFSQGILFQQGRAYCEIILEEKGSAEELQALAADLALRIR